MKKVLVTGGAGFVGSQLVEKLLAKNYSVVVVDNLSVGRISTIPKHKKCTFYEASISNYKLLEEVFQKEGKIDAVIHLAAIHYIPYCNDHLIETIETNVSGTINVLMLMQAYSIHRILFASSAAVYAPNSTALNEESLVGPVDIYGHSKVMGEQVITNLCKLFAIDYTILRLFNVCGKNDLVPHLIPSILDQAKVSSSIKLGNLTTKRDFVRKEDVAEAFIASLESDEALNEVFNVGTGISISVGEVVELIKSNIDHDLQVESVAQKQRKVDVNILNADSSKLKKMVGWQPKHTVAEFIEEELQ